MCVSSGHSTPTPTLEYKPLPRHEPQTKILPLGKPIDLEPLDTTHQIRTDTTHDVTYEIEETTDRSSWRKSRELEAGADLGQHIEEGQIGLIVDVEESLEKSPKTKRKIVEENYPMQLLVYEGSMSEKPLIVVLDRYPYEWYYDDLHPTPVKSQVDIHFEPIAGEGTVKAELGQQFTEAPVLVHFREGQKEKEDEQKRVSETSQLSIEHIIEETLEKSPKTKRKVDGLGQLLGDVVKHEDIEEEPIEEPFVRDDEVRRSLETSTHLGFEYEETLEKSPKIKRKVKEEPAQEIIEEEPHQHFCGCDNPPVHYEEEHHR